MKWDINQRKRGPNEVHLYLKDSETVFVITTNEKIDTLETVLTQEYPNYSTATRVEQLVIIKTILTKK